MVAHLLGLVGLIAWFWFQGGRSADAGPARVPDRPAGAESLASSDLVLPDEPLEPELPAEVDARKAVLQSGRYLQTLSDGSSVVFTLQPEVQQAAQAALDRYDIRWGALVAIEPATGRVLALAEKAGEGAPADAGRLVFDASAPAASVFKIVSAGALLTRAAVSPAERVCVHGGLRRLTEREIVGDAKRDRRCRPFAKALGHSDNTVFARLAYHRLEPEALDDVAASFGFNRALDLPWEVRPSILELPAPDDRVAFARVAAGFWGARLSPLHAALIAAAIGNRGVAQRPWRVALWRGAGGEVIQRGEPRRLGRFVDDRSAHVITRMMVETTRNGTARKVFNRRQEWPLGPMVEVAGKTGSLTETKPSFVAYSWFVAFAPAEEPRIAVAALVANPERWYVKAVHVARDALVAYFRAEEARAEARPKRVAVGPMDRL